MSHVTKNQLMLFLDFLCSTMTQCTVHCHTCGNSLGGEEERTPLENNKKICLKTVKKLFERHCVPCFDENSKNPKNPQIRRIFGKESENPRQNQADFKSKKISYAFLKSEMPLASAYILVLFPKFDTFRHLHISI